MTKITNKKIKLSNIKNRYMLDFGACYLRFFCYLVLGICNFMIT
jgi:hypothetical protein